jgi:hypothetical protein
MSRAPGAGPGSAREREALNLEERGALRRRLMDMSRLLPAIGICLFAVPLLWPAAEDSGRAVSMSSAIIYLFLCWGLLILLSLLFSLAVTRWASHWTGKTPRQRGEGP